MYQSNIRREDVKKKLLNSGIDTQESWNISCSNLDKFRKYNCKCPTSDQLEKKSLYLPIYEGLKEKDMIYIANKINKIVDK